MAPSGLAILLGAGLAAGAGIARVLASPSQGNLAVALLSRTGDPNLATDLSELSGGGILKAFKTDTSEECLTSTFDDIKRWVQSLPRLVGGLGAMRSNSGFAAYGATRASVRMLTQSLAREYSPKGIHVVHAVGNGWITNNYDES
ncbi:hypothetical protein BDV12DRAFT_201338 [Aspergillus spectabilis]